MIKQFLALHLLTKRKYLLRSPWSSVVLRGPPRSFAVLCGVFCGLLLSYVFLCGPLRSSAVSSVVLYCPMCSSAVLCGILCGPLRSSVVLCGPLWSSAVLCLCGPLRCPLWSSAVISRTRKKSIFLSPGTSAFHIVAIKFIL